MNYHPEDFETFKNKLLSMGYPESNRYAQWILALPPIFLSPSELALYSRIYPKEGIVEPKQAYGIHEMDEARKDFLFRTVYLKQLKVTYGLQ